MTGKTTGKKNPSPSQVGKKTLFRTGTLSQGQVQNGVMSWSRQTKTKNLRTLGFGKRPALRKCTENDTVRQPKKLLSNAEWPFRRNENRDG